MTTATITRSLSFAGANDRHFENLIDVHCDLLTIQAGGGVPVFVSSFDSRPCAGRDLLRSTERKLRQWFRSTPRTGLSAGTGRKCSRPGFEAPRASLRSFPRRLS
jgi:hypothetical protein